MTEGVNRHVDPHRPNPAAAHVEHDELLIARFATDDVAGTEAALARRLVRDCPSCSALFSDIAAISAATRTDLPLPRRVRDFRLSEQDAHRLRGRPGFVAWLRGLLLPGGSMLQPLAGAALSVGIALIVAGTILPSPTAPTQETGNGVAAPVSAYAAQTAAPSDARTVGGTADTPGDTAPQASAAGAAESSASATGTPAAAPASIAPLSTPAPTEARASSPVGTDASGPPVESSPNASPAAPETSLPAALQMTPPPVPSSGPTDGQSSGTSKGASQSPEASRLNAVDQATPTTAALAAGGEGSPSTLSGSGARDAGSAGPDPRPLLVALGLLLALAGALLIGIRGFARRA